MSDVPTHRMVDGLVVPLTEEEAASITAGWSAAESPVPGSVSRTQLHIALHRRGLLDLAQGVVAAAGGDDPEVLIRWAAPIMERASPLLIALATQPPLSLSAADIDAIFREAAAL